MNKVINDNESVCSNVSSTNNTEIIAAVFATASSEKWADENSCSMSNVSTNSNSQAVSSRTNRTSTTNTNHNQDEDDEISASDVLIDENNDQIEKASDMNSNEVDEEESEEDESAESITNGLSDDNDDENEEESSNENDDNNSRVSATSSSQMVIMTDSDDFVRIKTTDPNKSEKFKKSDKSKKEKKKSDDVKKAKTEKLVEKSKNELKKKRHRRTKMQMMRDAEQAAAAAQSAMDAVCASVLKKTKHSSIKNSHAKLNISKKNKKFDSKKPSNLNSQRLLRSTNTSMPQNATKKSKPISVKNNKKKDKKNKETDGEQLNGAESGDGDEVDYEYEDDLSKDQISIKASNKMSNENKMKKNYYQLNKLKRQQHLLLMQRQQEHKQKWKTAHKKKLLKLKQSEDLSKPKKYQTSLKSMLKRKCLICKRKVHQDYLNDHLIEHFNESSKCVECEKVSTNPSNFVTHILSHLDNQFMCISCDKLFKQPALYKRHREQCELDQQNVEPKTEESLKNVQQQQPRQRGRPRLIKNMPDSSQVSKSSSQTSIQTAKSSNVKTSAPVSVPKRLGRPPKYLKQESTQQQTVQMATTMKDQPRTSKRAKTTPSQTSEDNLDEINVSDYEHDEKREHEAQAQVQRIVQSKQKTNGDEIQGDQSDEAKEQEAKRNMRRKLQAIPPSLTEQQKDHLSKIANTGGGALANAIASLALKPSNNDLKTCGTYKVKLEIRKPNKHKEEIQTTHTNSRENSLNRSASFTLNDLKQTPSKSSSLINTFMSTSKSSQLISSSSQQTSLTSSSFECPECKRKFVSYYGLVQHYDQHPNLAVTCFICEITFDNHNSLVQHNTNLHHQQENTAQKDPKKGNIKTSKQTNGNQQTSNQKGRNVNEKVDSNGLNEITNTLPSIMTRTSRQNNNNPHQQPSIFNQLKLANSANQSSVLMNHSLTVKTTGFADLAFIDFSCTSFPRIAQSYCELWPRRIQSNQQQPLHKYSCDQCGFYFPCRASLKLHMLKKQFASSKLAINDIILNNLDNLNELRIKNNCTLFMTNSKYTDYEKTLDEIINTLERKEKQLPNQSLPDEQLAFSRSNRKEILKALGLVHKNELNELNEKYTVTQTTMNTNQLISLNKELNLEEFISSNLKPKLVSKIKILMLQLRKQMLDINHQFEIDLNRWKYMNFHYAAPTGTGISSNKNSFPIDLILEQYANKVQMKPHVNFNRPLLIRSKRLKRNAQKVQPLSNHTVTQSTKVGSSLTTYSSTATSASNTKTSFYEKQPVFSATSGNFSASNQLNLNKKRKLNERDQENQFVVVVSKQELKRSKQRIQQQQEMHEEIEKQRESELKEHLVSRKRRKGLTKRNEDEKELNSHRHSHFEHLDEDAHDALELQDEESDQDYRQVEDERSKRLTNKNKKQKAQEEEERELSDNNFNKQEALKSKLKAKKPSTSVNANSGLKLPAPPVLLKTVNTSANSSILARASGMSMNLVKQMPKLQPINSQPQMPKLKPISQMNQNEVSKREQNGPIPSPPQLIWAKNKTGPKMKISDENKKEKKLTNGHHKHINDHDEELVEEEVSNIEECIVNNENQGQEGRRGDEEESESESERENTRDEEEQSEENSEMIDSLVKVKNSEHLSLKCKFCYLIFKVQSDFFQHVITNHPKMLKKCLNRAEQNSTKKLGSKKNSSTSKNKTQNKKEINLTNQTQLMSQFLSTSSK
jgi:hypothetical protein